MNNLFIRCDLFTNGYATQFSVIRHGKENHYQSVYQSIETRCQSDYSDTELEFRILYHCLVAATRAHQNNSLDVICIQNDLKVAQGLLDGSIKMTPKLGDYYVPELRSMIHRFNNDGVMILMGTKRA